MALPNFSSIAKSVTSFAQGTSMPKSGSTVFDILDPAKQRRMISGLPFGGGAALSKLIPNFGFSGGSAGASASAAGEDDWRVRLSLADSATIFYKDTSTQNSIMAPLIETNGVIWPYTPSIQVSHVANYSTAVLTHSNYSAHFYNNSDVNDITVSGEFTVQSVEEGQYLMAAIYFLRASTKMFFGQGANMGSPPPILFLDGYGSHYFPHVPCVVTNFTHNLSNDVDYLQVPITQTTLEDVVLRAPDNPNGSIDLATNSITGSKGETFIPDMGRGTRPQKIVNSQKFTSIVSTTRVPTASTVSVTLRPVYSRQNIHDRFNLNDFAQGKLVGDKKAGYGGFL